MQGAKRTKQHASRKSGPFHRADATSAQPRAYPAAAQNWGGVASTPGARSVPVHGGAQPRQKSSRITSEWLTSLGQRFTTAFILMPVVIAITWFGGWVAFGGALLVVLVGMWEFHGMFTQRGWHPISLLSVALCVDFLVAAMVPQHRALILLLGVSAALILSFLWLMIVRQTTLEGSLTDWALTLVVPFYLGWPLAFFLLLRGDVAGYKPAGFWWTLTTLFTVWAFDTFAFFAGRFFGRTKLAPLISPKKTWEGVAGGLIFALIASFLFTRPINVPWYHAVILGVLVSIAATLGDLAESLLKRDTGVKDSGTLMRGHGGVLDRVDSLLFAVIVVLFYAVFLGSVTL
ncbi:MAG TPA: phosphatidate cytidylyltransferase [Ktedonobacterales bacterium]